jgi:hypothetical protein
MAMNNQAITQEMLEVMFSMQSATLDKGQAYS